LFSYPSVFFFFEELDSDCEETEEEADEKYSEVSESGGTSSKISVLKKQS